MNIHPALPRLGTDSSILSTIDTDISGPSSPPTAKP